MSTLIEMYLEGKRIAEDIKIDYANRLLAIAAQQDQDERYEDAAVAAHEARYEAWLSLEGPNP